MKATATKAQIDRRDWGTRNVELALEAITDELKDRGYTVLGQWALCEDGETFEIEYIETDVLGIAEDVKPDGNTMGACDKGCPGCGMTFSPDPAICPPEVFKGWTKEKEGIELQVLENGPQV